MKGRNLFQDFKIAIFALIAAFALFLTCMALIPEPCDVEIKEEIKISSSLLSEGLYQVDMTGVLHNKTENSVTVDRVSVESDHQFSLETGEIVIPARSDATLSIHRESDSVHQTVKSVTATVSGESVSLRNPAVDNVFGYALLPFLAFLLFAYLTVHASIFRYYLYQEDHM